MKIVLAGDGAVGKTALRERYLGKGFSSNYMMTIGADFALKEATIREKSIKFQIWGNKVDLRDQFPNHVTDNQAEEFAEKLSKKTDDIGFPVKFMPTSAKTGLNVSAAFDMLGNVYLDYVEAAQKAK